MATHEERRESALEFYGVTVQSRLDALEHHLETCREEIKNISARSYPSETVQHLVTLAARLSNMCAKYEIWRDS